MERKHRLTPWDEPWRLLYGPPTAIVPQLRINSGRCIGAFISRLALLALNAPINWSPNKLGGHVERLGDLIRAICFSYAEASSNLVSTKLEPCNTLPAKLVPTVVEPLHWATICWRWGSLLVIRWCLTLVIWWGVVSNPFAKMNSRQNRLTQCQITTWSRLLRRTSQFYERDPQRNWLNLKLPCQILILIENKQFIPNFTIPRSVKNLVWYSTPLCTNSTFFHNANLWQLTVNLFIWWHVYRYYCWPVTLTNDTQTGMSIGLPKL